jgi:membrane protein CcdC involved in cytochrome C biogenesis
MYLYLTNKFYRVFSTFRSEQRIYSRIKEFPIIIIVFIIVAFTHKTVFSNKLIDGWLSGLIFASIECSLIDPKP